VLPWSGKSIDVIIADTSAPEEMARRKFAANVHVLLAQATISAGRPAVLQLLVTRVKLEPGQKILSLSGWHVWTLLHAEPVTLYFGAHLHPEDAQDAAEDALPQE